MPTLNQTQVSAQNISTNRSRLRRGVDGIFKKARHAPMYKKQIVDEKTGKKSFKYTRLLNRNAFPISAALACQTIATESENELKRLGIDSLPESKLRPWNVSFAPGSVFALEQFFAAQVQQIMYNAKIIRDNTHLHSKNHKSVIALAIEEWKRAVVAPASEVPISTIVIPMVLARKTKKGEKEAPGEQKAPDAPTEEGAGGEDEDEDDDEEEGGENGENDNEGGDDDDDDDEN